MARWGMVIDLEKCTGCQACSVACAMANSRLPGEAWQDVIYYTEGEYPSAQLKWLPRPCMHCENPPCVSVCPVKATYKTDDGIVVVDWTRCVGCRFCMIACPYGARFYTDEKPAVEPDIKKVFKGNGKNSWQPPWKMQDSKEDWRHGVGIQPERVVSKCNFCYQRVSKAPAGTPDLDPSNPALREFTPACVVACAPSARSFGDLDDSRSKVSKLIAEKRGVRLRDNLGTKPQVYYLTGEAPVVPSTRVTSET